MKILHVPFTYLPDMLGGTEVYVRALCHELQRLGADCAVAAPGPCNLGPERFDDDLPVYRFALSPSPLSAEGVPDTVADQNFQRVLETFQPDIVHLHARTAAVSHLLPQRARRSGAATVFTYHTPTVSCMRGTMMYRGQQTCDGRIALARCTACVLQKHGVPGNGLDRLLAQLPVLVGRALQAAGCLNGPARALRMTQIVSDAHARFAELTQSVDRIVAVCEWVAETLRVNGVSEPRLLLNRQGLTSQAQTVSAGSQARAHASAPLRVAYFGRLDPTKGVETLVRAVRSIPAAGLELHLHGIVQPGAEAFAAHLKALAGTDARIRFVDAVPSARVVQTMACFDLVAVPSEWLETGPLVVLEAFAARVPVFGSRLGGIAELVSDGVHGRLLPPADPAAWADALGACAASRDDLDRWRNQLPVPRTMHDVATEMWPVYQALLPTGGLRP